MSSVAFLLRARLRQQWRGWITVTLVAGVIGGATIATLPGARRTETSYERFVEATLAFGVVPRGFVPFVALGFVAIGTLLLANLAAAFPARLAGRTRPTVALHAE